jgi:hypothetical protein
MDGEFYRWHSPHTGSVWDLPGVYCVGNAITGKGNIKDSLKNAKRLGNVILGGMTGSEIDYEKLFLVKREEAREHVAEFLEYLKKMPPTTEAEHQSILARVEALRSKHQYNGDYMAWRNRILAQR